VPQKPLKRFIAGAVCPRCGLKDKIFIDPEADRRRCVSCGFSEDRPGDEPVKAPQQPAEPPTRVSRAAARRVETPAETVTLVDPASSVNKPGDRD